MLLLVKVDSTELICEVALCSEDSVWIIVGVYMNGWLRFVCESCVVEFLLVILDKVVGRVLIFGCVLFSCEYLAMDPTEKKSTKR